jgi:hypothetical protein
LAQLEVKEINSRKLSRTSTDFQGLSSPGIIFLQFKDFPGFSRPVDTLLYIGLVVGIEPAALRFQCIAVAFQKAFS